MNKEREKNPIVRVYRGARRHFVLSIAAGATCGTAEVLAVERVIKGELDQAAGVMVVPGLLALVTFYHFYKEGE